METPKAPFVVTIKRDGSGLIEFPAVNILSEPFRDVMVLFISSKGEFWARMK